MYSFVCYLISTAFLNLAKIKKAGKGRNCIFGQPST
jgi:hypothetical protein